jgi:hypothetical protein
MDVLRGKLHLSLHTFTQAIRSNVVVEVTLAVPELFQRARIT